MTIPWNLALAVWGSFFWRAFVYGIAGGFLFGLVGGMLAAANGEPAKGALYGAIGGYIATLPASLLALRQALGVHLASLSILRPAR